MTLPTSTYRLQFRDGMDFDRAAGLVPYFKALGISHLYASPIFTAGSGSTHGYDITDPTEVDPALGGRAGLDRLSHALKAEGLGLILDIVPNHMAFSPETPWLRDVLRHGTESRYARHFDMELATRRLRLPWLSAPFHRLAQEGALSVGDDPEGPVLVVNGGLRIPLAETATLDAARTDPSRIPKLHREQPWQATHWRTEMDAITHRRFFNITGLIGVRVEDPAVFEEAHSLIFDLVDSGVVDGLRVDHVDGLADPGAYLSRLRDRLPGTPVWVEKILTGPETLAEDWPVEGTTGYEVARTFARALTDPAGLEAITRAYRDRTGRQEPFPAVLQAARRQIMTEELSAELWSLTEMLSNLAASDPEVQEFGPETLRQSLIDLIAAFPRYRTYMTATVPPEDRELVERVAVEARSSLLTAEALPVIARIMTGESEDAIRFRTRFQQVTGAAVAKSQEDTAFYRDVALLSMNEVGGEPDDTGLDFEAFHAEMTDRARHMPHGLTLTSSHDTKRSEDARMRIAALSYHPELFDTWVDRCCQLARKELDPNIVWYLAQSRIALGSDTPDLAGRLAGHAIKALREAKDATFHTAPVEAVEMVVEDYAHELATTFARLPDDLDPILRTADRLTLALAALKLTAPGIPDIYQGCETTCYALTDPDNRRPVAFDVLARALDDPLGLGTLGAEKFRLTRSLLSLRRDAPEVFLDGRYAPIPAPEGTMAFERVAGATRFAVAVAPRHGTDAALPGRGAELIATSDGSVRVYRS